MTRVVRLGAFEYPCQKFHVHDVRADLRDEYRINMCLYYARLGPPNICAGGPAGIHREDYRDDPIFSAYIYNHLNHTPVVFQRASITQMLGRRQRVITHQECWMNGVIKLQLFFPLKPTRRHLG